MSNRLSELLLSLFPGIDLLGKAFEETGYCVLRSPDKIFGGDIRDFHVPPNKMDGVLGGPPCQEFSAARNGIPATGYGLEMLGEFVRVVLEARPTWWLMENVPRVPDVKIEGYSWQRLDVWAHEYGLKQRRLRHFQFGRGKGGNAVMRGKIKPDFGRKLAQNRPISDVKPSFVHQKVLFEPATKT